MQMLRERIREFGVLASIGFTRARIMTLLVAEVGALCFFGYAAGMGAAGVWAVFNGWTSSMLNQNSYSQVIYEFAVTPATLIDAATLALALGVLGCLAPAIHAVRRNVAASLHQD